MSKYSDLYEKVFGEKYIKESYKFISHQFNGRITGKQYCTKCGLVALNNQFTEWAIKHGCNNTDHPSYQSQRRKTG